MDIFFDKSRYIGLDPGFFERFWGEPLVSDKSFFFAWSRLCLSSIFDEK